LTYALIIADFAYKMNRVPVTDIGLANLTFKYFCGYILFHP